MISNFSLTIIVFLLLIIAIGILLIAFFMMALWRAVMGKSSVDLKLATTIDKNTKRVEALHKDFGTYGTSQDGLQKEVHDAKGAIERFIKILEKQDKK